MTRFLPRARHASLALAALAAAVSFSSPAPAQTAGELLSSGHVVIRARVEPPSVFVGQPASVEVDVLTRTWFLKAPEYPDTLDVGDAIVLPPEAFGVNFTEKIDGETYAGQTRSFTVFPARPGTIAVPSFPVTLAVADENARRTPDFTLKTPALRIEARLPEQARGLGLVVAAPSVTVTEEWTPAIDRPRTGDSVRRVVTMTIEDSVAMLLPSLELRAPEGIAVYPDRPGFEDRRARGRMRGTRVESVTYVFEREGTFVLPAATVHWWDLEADELRTETLPPVELEVVENRDAALPVFETVDEEETAAPTPRAREELPWRGALLATLLLALAALLARAFRRLRTSAERERAERGPGEPELFRRLERAARDGDPRKTLAACYAWLDILYPDGPVTLSGLAESLNDPELAKELEALGAAAVGSERWRSPTRLVSRLRSLRRKGIGPARPAIPALRPLNPLPRTEID